MRPLTAMRARVIGGAAAFCVLLAGQAAAVQAARAGPQASPGTASAPLRGWHRAIPTPGLGSVLHGAFCTSASDCWAVGSYDSSGFFNKGEILNQALLWNGSTWSFAATPDPGGTTSTDDLNELFGVSCASATDCWAVGFARTVGMAGLNEALNWNGLTWSTAAVPDPGGTATNAASVLTAIRCRSSGTCLAVGEYARGPSGTTPTLNQALRWNGQKWSTVPIPDPAGHGASSANDLAGLSCTSATDCWAVGFTSRGGEGTAAVLNQALHWNGGKWSAVSTPDPGGIRATSFSELLGAFCSSARNCWAVGEYGTSNGALNQVLHWNGRRWAKVSVPDPNGTGKGVINTLTGVTCTAAGNCWAVGFYGHTSRVNQVLHWNGHSWLRVASPDPAGTANGDGNVLEGVGCSSAALCWAVGAQQSAGQAGVNEALRWNGRHWLAG